MDRDMKDFLIELNEATTRVQHLSDGLNNLNLLNYLNEKDKKRITETVEQSLKIQSQMNNLKTIVLEILERKTN